MSQSMSRRQDHLAGNILLDDYLYSKRAPPLLHRNLNRVFRIHQYISQNGSTEGIQDSYHDFRSKWRPPSWDTLDDMITLETSRGSFELNVHGFKPLNPNHAFANDRDEPHRKARPLLKVRSTIYVTVYRESSEFPHKSLPAQIATVEGKDSNHSTKAAVEMDPMTIQREDLSVHQDEDGPRFDKSYKLGLSVNFNSWQDAEELYQHMGYDATGPSTSTRLSTSYANILDCPEGTTLLPLTASRERLGFGIEMSMYWRDTSDESVLMASNRQQRNSVAPLSYPSPPTESEPKYFVIFFYGEGKAWRSGLGCPHCPRRTPATFLEFEMHMKNFHERFNYRIFNDGEDVAGVIQLRCETHQPNRYIETARSLSDPYHHQIPAPWQWEATGPLTPLPAPGGPVVFGAGLAPSNGVPSLRQSPLDGTWDPEKVRDIPIRKKRIFQVPKAPPDVIYFRSFSKRPFIEGENVGESDDEVDMSWMETRKDAEMQKLTLISESTKRFLKIYDKHMAEEGVQSGRCLGDALVRFVRKNATLVWQQDVVDEFKRKMNELLEDNMIVEPVHSWCIKTVEGQRPGSRDASDLTQRLAGLGVQSTQTSSSSDIINQSPARRRVDKGKGKANVTDTGNLTPITADSDGDIEMREVVASSSRPSTAQQPLELEIDDPPYDLCICGNDARINAHGRDVISCSAIVSYIFSSACARYLN